MVPTAGLVLTGSHDTVYARDPQTLRVRETYWVRGGAYADELVQVGLSRAGDQVVAVFRNAVFLWRRGGAPDLPDGRIRRFEGTGFREVIFSPDRKRFLLDDGSKNPSLWTTSATRERVLMGHTELITALSFSTHGRRVLSASADGEVRIWNLSLDLAAKQIAAADDDVRQLALTRDERRLLTRDSAGVVRVYNLAPAPAARPSAPAVYGAAFLADEQILTADTAGNIGQREPGGEATTLGRLPGPVLDLQRRGSPPTLLALVAGPRAPVLYVYREGRWQASAPGPFARVVGSALLPGGQQALVFSARGGIALLHLADSTARVLRREGTDVWTPATIRQGLVLSPAGHFGLLHRPNGPLLLEPGAGRVYALRGHAEDIATAAFSADDQTVVTASTDGVARLWDARTGVFRTALIGHEAPLTAVACGPAGWVATGSRDGSIRLWNGSTGQGVGVLRGNKAPVAALCFAGSGQALWSAGRDGQLRQFTLNPQWYLDRARQLLRASAAP